MKVTSTLWPLNTFDQHMIVFDFPLLILSIVSTVQPTNFKKSYSWISKKHDQTSINLTNVFDFIGWFSVFLKRSTIPSSTYMFKVSTQNTRKTCQIYSKLTIKIPEWLLVLLFLTWNIFQTLFYDGLGKFVPTQKLHTFWD